MKKPAKNFIALVVFVIACELVGFAGVPFTSSAIPTWYTTLNKPIFSPPNWLFGPVWTLLYFLMGVSFWLIWRKGWKKKKVRDASIFFGAQLFFNLIWSPAFFGLRSPLLGLMVIIPMWILIWLTIKKFETISKTAAWLLVPYLLWVSFATMLNASILILN